MSPPSRLEISIPTASFDGIFHGRYPQGNAPSGAVLSGAATDATSASGSIAQGAHLAGTANDVTSASGAFTGPPLSFDLFVSPNGDDATGNGSLSSPYSITMFNKYATINYSGKKIGVIGDVGQTLTGFVITGTAGQFSCNSTTLTVGQYVMIDGTFGGTGSISGYATGTIYELTATNGTTTGTLSPLGGDMTAAAPALVTTAGTPTGLTYAVNQPITFGTTSGSETTLLSLINASANQPALNINGGTSSASTYVASCNSAGVYTPLWAIIDFAPGGVSTITSQGSGMGQNSEESTQVPKPGFLTYDALSIRNFSFAAILFRNDGGSALNGCVIKNCDVYNGGNVESNNNPGALHFSNHFGSIVTNCKVHGLQTISGGTDPLWGNSAIMQYGQSGQCNWNVTFCTFYNCASVLCKDAHQDINMSYCYCDVGIFGSAPEGGLNAGVPCGLNPSSFAATIHHNIMMRGVALHPLDGTTVTGQTVMYNNTIYGPASGGAALATLYADTPGTGGSIEFFNNVVYSINGYNISGATGSCYVKSGYTLSNTTFNNNVYGNGMTFAVTADASLSFATWKSDTGVDSTSVLLGSGVSPFVGTPSARNMSSFQTNANAVIGGVTCGALDGSGSIGCTF